MFSRALTVISVSSIMVLLLAACENAGFAPASTAAPTPTATPEATPTSATTGSIEGAVIWTESDEIVANAIVKLNDPSKDSDSPDYQVAETVSDDEGHYRFIDIEPGEYSLSATLDFGQYTYTFNPGSCQSASPFSFSRDEDGNLLASVSGTTADGSAIYGVVGFKAVVEIGKTTIKDLGMICG